MNPKTKATYAGIGLAVLAAFIWSGNFIIARKVIRDIPPVSLAFYRWLLASAIIFPFAMARFSREWRVARSSLPYLFWAALTGVALFNTFVYIGAHHTSAIKLTLIGTTTSPIVATVLARVFLHEKLGLLKICGLLLCIVGVLVLLSNGSFEALLQLKFSRGDLWVIAAGFCFAVYNTMVKKKPTGISPINFLFLIFSIGTFLLLPFYLFELSEAPKAAWSTELILFIIYLGLGASVICFIIWNMAIHKIGAARTILFGNMIPIFGTIGSVVLLHEKFEWIYLVSMLIVFAGIILANIRSNR